MTTDSYDRSGRMSYETFEVNPSSGFSDPLASYFNGVLTSPSPNSPIPTPKLLPTPFATSPSAVTTARNKPSCVATSRGRTCGPAKALNFKPTMPFGPSTNWSQHAFGENLGRALLVNQGWITDDRLRSEVLKRCVGEQMCRTLQQVSATSGPPYQVILYQVGGGRVSIHVGPYEIPNLDLLKNKLSQYPAGTTFTLIPPD